MNGESIFGAAEDEGGDDEVALARQATMAVVANCRGIEGDVE